MTPLGHPQGVSFKHNTKNITVVLFSIETQQLCRLKLLKFHCCMFLQFWRNVLRTSTKCHEKTSTRWRTWDIPRASVLSLSNKSIFMALFSISFHQKMFPKHYRVTYFIVLVVSKSVPKTSCKGYKVTSGGWRLQDVAKASILNISAKRISVVILSFFVHRMCVLDTKKLVIAYSSNFIKTD